MRPELELDHVVLAVRDLDGAAERIEREHGLASYPGGRHSRGGTANRIVPLGGQYLELMALVAPEEAAGWGLLVRELAAEGDRPCLWCVRTHGIEALAARLGLEVAHWSRTLPDRSELSWRLAGAEQAALEPALPFFIEWDDIERHPGRSGAQRGEVTWIEVAGDEARLRDWLGGASLPLRVLPGGPEVRRFAVSTPRGGAVFGV
jgi:hypothetical protein